VKASSIDVYYVGSTALQVKYDGAVVRSGGVIPPGSYTVVVHDDAYDSPKFSMSGPGVNWSSDLNTSMGGWDLVGSYGPYTLQPNASYRVEDTGISGSIVVFGTSADAASAGAASSGGGSGSSGGSNSNASSGSGSTKTSITTTTKLVGTLRASVGAAGPRTLTFGGKAATTLHAGRYTVAVDDRSKTAGLVVGMTPSHSITLSGASAVGSSSHVVTLSVGRWFYATTAGGAKTYFTVVK
jgi:hypothetical protein